MKLIIGADVIPKNGNIDAFIDGDINKIMNQELLLRWNAADYRLFNLETPLVDTKEPIQKHGSNFNTTVKAIRGIIALRPDVVCLANNHIMDQDEQGLDSTVHVLEKHGIEWTGICENSLETHPTKVIQHLDMKVGIYNCAETEFSVASENRIGAIPFDPLESLDVIQDLKATCDAVIVLFHGGIEYYRYPSPMLQRICRKMVEKGADLVVCQHSHCVGSFEHYNSGTIIYGQGNFIFDIDGIEGHEFFSDGMLVEVTLHKHQAIDVDFVPIKLRDHQVKIAYEDKSIIQGLKERSSNLNKQGFIQNEYLGFTSEKLDFYLDEISARGKWIRRVDKYLFKGKFLKKMYNTPKLNQLVNYIECEAHREALVSAIHQKRGE